MFNLYQILTGAQGGQALDNLAARFGLTLKQADSAAKALVPALSTALVTKAMQPGGLQEIAGAMTDDHHKQAYADPGIAAMPETQAKGSGIAASVFGDPSMVDTVVREAARYTGVSEPTLRRMLPVVASIVIGGVATEMHNQGMGGWLGQLANGGFGGMFAPGAADAGLGSLMGGMFGGARPGQPQGSAPPGGAWSGMAPAMQAGMDAFGKMFQSGVPSQFGQMGDFGERISSILAGKRG